jgi:hypothetical protein
MLVKEPFSLLDGEAEPLILGHLCMYSSKMLYNTLGPEIVCDHSYNLNGMGSTLWDV